MLKELFESQFYYTYPNVKDRVLMIEEFTKSGEFSLVDPKACVGCKVVCGERHETREQLKIISTKPVNVVNLEQVFSFVKDDIGDVCDFMMEGEDSTYLVEMSCSTAEYVKSKRPKAREQLYNSLVRLFTCAPIRSHIEKKTIHFVVFSWKETFPPDTKMNDVEKIMRDMTIMSDAVYSPDNESKFEFGFKLREIRYPCVLAC